VAAAPVLRALAVLVGRRRAAPRVQAPALSEAQRQAALRQVQGWLLQASLAPRPPSRTPGVEE
jgi:hypothetical protein